MNIRNLKKVLPALLRHKIVPYLHGAQGIGKTSVVRQYCLENGLKFIPLYLATQDQGDLVGLLNKNNDGTVSHLPPDWMKEAQEGKGIVFLDECFPGNTQIITSKGILSIKQIYTKFQNGEEILVKSFNESNKTFEFKKVTEAWNRGKKPVIGLKMGSNNTFNCTEDHPILTSQGYKKAKDLRELDLIVSHIHSKEKTGTPALGEDQVAVLRGSILGDGCFVKPSKNTSYLSMIHGEDQKDYLAYKAEIFNAKYRKVDKNGYAQNPAYTFRTRLIAEYAEKKRSEMFIEAIDNLCPKSLAIWFQDDGSRGNRGSGATFHTEGWSKSTMEYAVEKLNKMGYSCHSAKSGEYRNIYVSAEGFRKLSSAIAPYVHPCIRYKLDEKDRGVEFVKLSNKFKDYGYMVFSKHISATCRLDANKKCYVYDLEVEDNHNFIICTRKHYNGIVVHNCNRAHPDVLQVMFPFLQTGKIHRQGIGPEWRIIAAGNYQNNKFTQTDMSDTALLSRFCHIDVKPEAAEFSSYAEDMGLDCLASFIRDQPKFLISDAGEGLNLDNIPYDPRAWLEKVSPLAEEGLGEHEYEVIAGCVGRAAAAAYITYKKKNERPISMSAILRDYDKVRAEVLKHTSLTTGESRFDLLNTAITELYGRLDKTPDLLDSDKLENLKRFLLDLPRELSMSALRGLGGRKFKGKQDLVDNGPFARKLLG